MCEINGFTFPSVSSSSFVLNRSASIYSRTENLTLGLVKSITKTRPTGRQIIVM